MENPPARLRSRYPVRLTEFIKNYTEHLRKERWNLAVNRKKFLVKDPTIKVPGCDFTRGQ